MNRIPIFAIFEDNPDYQKEIAGRVKQVFKEVVIKFAGDMLIAKELIESGEELDFATVDGNLYEEDKSGDDGRELEILLRNKYPKIKVIEISGRGNDLESPDFRLTKMRLISTEAFQTYLKSLVTS